MAAGGWITARLEASGWSGQELANLIFCRTLINEA
jgi:hypothetical protein